MENIKNVSKMHFSVEDPTTPYYGYVPFKYFQLVIIILIVLSFIFKDQINEKLNKHVYSRLNKYVKNRNLFTIIRVFIALIAGIMYFQLKYFALDKIKDVCFD